VPFQVAIAGEPGLLAGAENAASFLPHQAARTFLSPSLNLQRSLWFLQGPLSFFARLHCSGLRSRPSTVPVQPIVGPVTGSLLLSCRSLQMH